MKPLRLFLILFSAVAILQSCEKDNAEFIPMAGIKIVNSVTGGTTARLNSQTTNIATNAAGDFVLATGNPDIYVYPVGDSSKPYYNSGKGVTVANNEYYTLFLAGTVTTAEGILVKESYQNYTDSVLGVRFINLSPNSTPVNVTLSTGTTVNEFVNIAYKQLTDFKQLPSTAAVTSYTFQVRSTAAPATVLASFAVTVSGSAAMPRFKNISLVYKGLAGGTGTNAPTIVRVNHY